MSIKNICNLIITVCICLLITISCTPKGELSEEKPAAVTEPGSEGAKDDVLDLAVDRVIVPLEHPKSGVIKGQNVIGVDEAKTADSVYQLVEDIPDEIDSLNSQAYRVQLFSSKVFGESRREKLIAEEIFDRPVFMDYEVPYYKIRVGNFSNREKAEEYQMRAKSAGYTNAWVVAVTVNIRETAPLYDGFIKPPANDSAAVKKDGENY